MEIKKGYKKTLMGEIPSDWEFDEFSEVMDGFTSGQTPYRAIKRYYTGEIPWITSGELNYNIVTETNEKITEEALRNTGLKIIPKGTFLFAITGLEAAGTRGSCAITGTDAATNQSCMALYPKKNKLTTSYLYYYYLQYGNELALQYCQGTKQQSFTSKIAKRLPIVFPSKIKEQNEITAAIGEVDSLIKTLKKIIDKKQSIKQGMMQRLFTPKPDWGLKLLEEIGKPYGGLSGKSKSDFHNGNCPYIPFMNVLSNPVIDSEYFDYVKIRKGESQNLAMKGDLFFNGSSETPEDVGMCSVLLKDIPNLYLNSFCFGFRLRRELNINSLYLSYFFRSDVGRRIIYSSAQGATRYNLSKGNFLKLQIQLPSPNEQDDISVLLFDIDKEIFKMEAKLKKIVQVKQGMMQTLLTGKIRLL
jgi:type I restriction enzyme S subunit